MFSFSFSLWRVIRYIYLFFGRFMMCEEVFLLISTHSYSIETLDVIRNSNHGQEVPHKWPMSNLLWNDPDHDVIGVFHLIVLDIPLAR